MKRLYVVVDLDGTLREISHRRHLISNGNNQWDEFFLSCDKDEPVWPVIDIFAALVNAGHRVEVWSGASEISREMTIQWFGNFVKPKLSSPPKDMGDFLVHMRPQGNYTPDEILKKQWLDNETVKPDIIFDDRIKVVEMWRDNGICCAQVAKGDFDTPKVKRPRKPKLTLMIGPSGAGKTRYISGVHPYSTVVSTDKIRREQYPDRREDVIPWSWCDPIAYTPEGFVNTHGAAKNLAKANLDGGLDVVYDATNLKRKNRIEILNHVGAINGDIDVEYVVIDRPIEDKLNDFNKHTSTNPTQRGRTSEDIIRKHHQTFQSSKKFALNGDGLDFVTVKDFTK